MKHQDVKKYLCLFCVLSFMLMVNGCAQKHSGTTPDSEQTDIASAQNDEEETKESDSESGSQEVSGASGQSVQEASDNKEQEDNKEASDSGKANTNETSSDGSTAPAVDVDTNSAANQPSDGMITLDDAKSKALAHAGLSAEQATFVKSKLDHDDGRQIYEVEFYTQDHREYEYEIDAYTGDIIGYDYDAEHHMVSNPVDSGSGITAEKAKELALLKIPGAGEGDVWEFEADYDDGRLEYEGKIIYNGMEYEFEIDGNSGTILSWEEEPVGH